MRRIERMVRGLVRVAVHQHRRIGGAQPGQRCVGIDIGVVAAGLLALLAFRAHAARDLLALKERPTAVVLVNESTAIGLYRGLQEAGVMPGRDIAVIGRQSPTSHFLSPRLTAFRLSLHDLGEALAEALLATMPDYARHYPQGITRKVWPMELVPGESDGFSPPP